MELDQSQIETSSEGTHLYLAKEVLQLDSEQEEEDMTKLKILANCEDFEGGVKIGTVSNLEGTAYFELGNPTNFVVLESSSYIQFGVLTALTVMSFCSLVWLSFELFSEGNITVVEVKKPTQTQN